MLLNYLDSAIGFAVIMLLLSLLITVFVQALVVALGLRGIALRKGVALLLDQFADLGPGLKDRAEDIADGVLNHPAIRRQGWFLTSLWQRASDIRKDELLALLSNADAIADMPGLDKEKDTIAAAVKAKQDALETWFDHVMDRTTERFVSWTRGISLAAALLLALFLQVDSIALIKRIQSDSTLRAKLVGLAPTVLALADTVDQGRYVATAALDSLRNSRDQVIRTAVAAKHDSLATRDQGRVFLINNVSDSTRRATALKTYEARFDSIPRIGAWQDSTPPANAFSRHSAIPCPASSTCRPRCPHGHGTGCSFWASSSARSSSAWARPSGTTCCARPPTSAPLSRARSTSSSRKRRHSRAQAP